MGEVWVPLLSGVFDFSAIGEKVWLSVLLGTLFNGLIVASLLVLNAKSANNVFSPQLSAALFLLVLLANPAAIHFSSIHPAVLLFIWGQYCFIENQKFTSMFLLSCSALFYAPLIWLLPIVWIISITGVADIPRVAVKSLGGLVLPIVYLLCFRFMAFNDAGTFIDDYMSHATDFASPFQSLKFVMLFYVGCLGVILLHSVSYMFSRLYNNSIITEHILKMEFMSLVLGVLVWSLFGGDSQMPLNMVVALPIGLLFSHYFTGNINAAAARIELILLCCAAVINRLSYFI